MRLVRAAFEVRRRNTSSSRAGELTETRVILVHVLKNTMIPAMRDRLEFGSTIAFSVVTESIFVGRATQADHRQHQRARSADDRRLSHPHRLPAW